jgi:hypothetical protein
MTTARASVDDPSATLPVVFAACGLARLENQPLDMNQLVVQRRRAAQVRHPDCRAQRKTALNHCGVFHYQFNRRTASRYNHRDLVLTLGTRLGPHEMSALATALGQLRFPGRKENSVPSRASQE